MRGRDLNPRPLGYEPNELPDCSTPRHCEDLTVYHKQKRQKTHNRVEERYLGTRQLLPFATQLGAHPPELAFSAQNPRSRHRERLGMRLARQRIVTVLGELLLVTSSVAVSLGLSRLALGELFRLVRIDSARPSQKDVARR